MITDPDPFEDENTEKKVFDMLRDMGINIHSGFNLHEIVADESGKTCNTIVIRK